MSTVMKIKNIFVGIFLILVGACVTLPAPLSAREQAIPVVMTNEKTNTWLHKHCTMKGILRDTIEIAAKRWCASMGGNYLEVLMSSKYKINHGQYSLITVAAFDCPEINLPE